MRYNQDFRIWMRGKAHPRSPGTSFGINSARRTVLSVERAPEVATRQIAKRESPSHKGSLLLEALLAVVILSFSVTLIIQAMTSSLRALLYSADYTTALVLAEDEMFDVLKKGFIEPGLSQERKFPLPYDRFQYALKAEALAGGDEEDLNEVSLDVSWGTRRRDNHIVLRTYLLSPPEHE